MIQCRLSTAHNSANGPQGRSTEAGETVVLKGLDPKCMKPKQHCRPQTTGAGSTRPFVIYGLLISQLQETQNAKWDVIVTPHGCLSPEPTPAVCVSRESAHSLTVKKEHVNIEQVRH